MLCGLCRTLADPTCECLNVAAHSLDTTITIYCDDLSTISLTNVWKDDYGRVKWLEELGVLAKAKVTTVYDIALKAK